MSKYKNANIEIKRILDKYNQDGIQVMKVSKNEYLVSQKPGATVPKHVPLGDKYKEHWEEVTCKMKSDINAVIKAQKDILVDSLTKVPDTNVVNAINLVNMKTHITEHEMDLLMDKYKDTPLAYNTLRDIAIRHGIRTYEPHPIEQEIERIEILESSINHIRPSDLSKYDDAMSGYIEMQKYNVDLAFPTDDSSTSDD